MAKQNYILSIEKEMNFEYIRQLLDGKVKSNCIPSLLLLGEPGSGKTSFGKYVAEKLDAELIFAQCYDGVAAEQLVYNWDLGTLVDAMTDEEVKGREAMRDGYLLQALKKSHKGKVVLLIDEIDKARPSVDTFLLSFMQECMLNDPLTGIVRGVKENIFIIATSNKRRELEDALDRRFTFVREFSFPDRKELVQQIDSMLTVPYDAAKKSFLIDLVIKYRSTGGINKKPSQNQIVDLINELVVIDKKAIGRKTRANLKFEALLWKLSQEKDDQNLFKSVLPIFYPTLKKDRIFTYVGSML